MGWFLDVYLGLAWPDLPFVAVGRIHYLFCPTCAQAEMTCELVAENRPRDGLESRRGPRASSSIRKLESMRCSREIALAKME
jgi:hypothetical protein